MKIRDRVKELRRVKAGDLQPCPWNWREHPLPQREALRAVLAEIGFAGACIARERNDGKIELIDGHLRASLDPDEVLPVLLVDLDDGEAKKLLATFDPLAAMADANEEAQRKLLEEIDAEEAGFRKLLAEMLAGVPEAADKGEKGEGAHGPPEMELRPHEHYDYLLVLARTTHAWNRLVDLLGIKKVQTEHGKIGIGRGFEAEALIAILEAAAYGKQKKAEAAATKG